MPRRKLQNYLKTYRKRYGLTQTEVAYLLGCRSAAKVSRYECFTRLPNLKTVLFYEALFGAPVAEMFAGLYQQVEKEASQRARILMHELESSKSKRIPTRKADLLRAVVVTPDILKENS